MSVTISRPTGAVIMPDSADGRTTNLRWRTDQIRAALHREWLPGCRGAWSDRLDSMVGGAR